MPRIRSIKPEFFTSEDICSLTVKARLTYIGLWCHADREGRLKYAPITLAAAITPYDMPSFCETLDELIETGLVIHYTVSNKNFLCIPTFSDHQRPHKTERSSKIEPLENGDVTVRERLEERRSSTGKGKGKGKGKGMVLNPPKPPLEKIYPDGLDMAAWQEWEQHRIEIKKPMTPLAEKKAMNKLLKLANGITQQQIVDHSIAGGYQGLYPPKDNGKETLQSKATRYREILENA